MKMFTKLIRPFMLLLLMVAIVVVQAQIGKPTQKSLVSDIQQSTKIQKVASIKEIPAADVVEGVGIGQVSAVNSNFDLSKIATKDEAKGLLYSNGPFVTNPGGGFGGADLSMLQNTSLGLQTLGANFNAAAAAGIYFYMADDFTATSTWTLSYMKFFGYQSGSTTASTFTGVYVQIWNGDPSLPTSTVVYGDLTTNRLISTAWTNCYRAAENAPTGSTRPIMELVANMSGCVLPAGAYWVQVGATGSLASGPWAPPISILGQAVTGNGKQKISTGWVNWLDTGTGTPAQGLPFEIYSPAANDVSVSLISSPNSFEQLGVKSVTINVTNNGTVTQSNIPVSYVYNSITYNGTVPGSLVFGATATYTFPQTINPSLGANTLTACTNLAGDENTANDCKVKNFYVTPVYTCEWTIDLIDDYGDGWNGATMDVISDGFTVLPGITLGGGTGPVTFSFGVNTGDPVATLFVLNGLYPEECIYNIYNNFGALVASSGPTGVIGVPPPNVNVTGNCECVVECPVGALAEGEAQIPNEGADVTNGGCNMLPGTPLFTQIAILSGETKTFCGQTNTYTTTGGTVFRRDTDWYRFSASSSPAKYWNIKINVTAEFDLQVLLINAGADNCTDYSIVKAVTVFPCQTATIDEDFPSGIYYIWVGPQTAAGNLYPYGSGPYDYAGSLNITEKGAPVITPAPPAEITMLVPPGGSTSMNLPIGNSGTYALEYSAVTSGTYNQTWQDQFDTYAAGLQLAVQNPAQWTTWSNAPGSAEDPFVSNEQAYTGANSVKIEGTNDAVHLFGNLTTGSYLVSHRMYVVPGYVGYFNTLLTFAAPTYEWGMQVAFEVDGTATLDAGVFSAATFNYTPGTWMLNEVYVDLDNDYAEYWFNGTFVWSWQWSVGTGGYTTNQLAANNFFAYTGTGGTDTPRFYIDDYQLLQAGNDWLTINGGLGASGIVAVGGGVQNLTIQFLAGTKPVGTYTKVINLVTNELSGAKNAYAIAVTMQVGYSLSGNVYYGNTGTKIMGANTTVTLTPGPTTVPVGATLSDYDIRPLANGNYLLTGATTKPGANAQITTADAILVTRMAAGLGTPYSTLQYRAGDVNLSNQVTTSDAILIKRRAAGLSSNWSAPVYVFDGPFGPPNPVLGGTPVIISGSNVTKVLRVILSGDMNSSHTP